MYPEKGLGRADGESKAHPPHTTRTLKSRLSHVIELESRVTPIVSPVTGCSADQEEERRTTSTATVLMSLVRTANTNSLLYHHHPQLRAGVHLALAARFPARSQDCKGRSLRTRRSPSHATSIPASKSPTTTALVCSFSAGTDTGL